MQLDSSLSNYEVKYVPWAPSWEDGIDANNNGHASASLASKEKRNFTETERELIQRGMDLVVGVPEPKISVTPDFLNILTTPVPTHTIHHCVVKKYTSGIEKITLQKEDTDQILLVAEKASPHKDGIWTITSPVCDLGDCTVYSKNKNFYCVQNDFEEIAVRFKPSKVAELEMFDVVIPALVRDSGNRTPIHYEGSASYLLSHSASPQDQMPPDCVRLSSREPQKKDSRYVLMFNGRVKKPSKKNFILILPSMPAREILLCGKRATKEYVFDMNWPLSFVQGFAIYLTLFSK